MVSLRRQLERIAASVARVLTRVDQISEQLCQGFTRLEGMIMSAQDDINTIAADLVGVGQTLSDAIARLEAQVAAGETPDLTALKDAAARLDALAAANPEPAPPTN